MSFLDKLKVKIEEGEHGAKNELPKKIDAVEESDFLQLDVDIYQTSTDIIINAPIPGVEAENLDITVENENDVVTIQGKRVQPKQDDLGKYLRQECHWGQFYRQIILPQEVDVSRIDARFKKGILTLTMPLLRLQGKGKKKIEVK